VAHSCRLLVVDRTVVTIVHVGPTRVCLPGFGQTRYGGALGGKRFPTGFWGAMGAWAIPGGFYSERRMRQKRFIGMGGPSQKTTSQSGCRDTEGLGQRCPFPGARKGRALNEKKPQSNRKVCPSLPLRWERLGTRSCRLSAAENSTVDVSNALRWCFPGLPGPAIRGVQQIPRPTFEAKSLWRPICPVSKQGNRRRRPLRRKKAARARMDANPGPQWKPAGYR